MCAFTGLAQVTSEPILQESTGDDTKGLRADWSVRGFWEHQRVALFDICILNADAKSLQNQSLKSIFNTRKQIKKDKYCAAAESRRATFTPIIASCEAIFESEAEVYFKRLATILSKKMEIFLLSCTLLHQSQNADLHNEVCKLVYKGLANEMERSWDN